jgi:hypothetical protein
MGRYSVYYTTTFLDGKMAVYDGLAEQDNDGIYEAWKIEVDVAKEDILNFVTQRLGLNKTAILDEKLDVSFDLCLVVKASDGAKYVIRFPKPGDTAASFLEEKVRDEVQVLKVLQEKTSILVPEVLSWGTTDESPSQIGPFLIMEFKAGMKLCVFLQEKGGTEHDDVKLLKEVGNPKLDRIYEQIANYMLELARLDSSAIGAISEDPSGE